MERDEAIAYLSTIGPHSNPPKIRTALDAIKPGPDDETWLRKIWTNAAAALDALQHHDGSPGARVNRADARDELQAAVEALLDEMGQLDGTEPVTAPVTDMPGGAENNPVTADVTGYPRALGVLEAYRILTLAEQEWFRAQTHLTETPDVTRLCACGCGRAVTSPRREARYATGACRVRAHRARA